MIKRNRNIKYKEYFSLSGNKQLLVQQVGDGSIIKRFDKTPFPKNPSDVICPHFLELKWANGCRFDCAWCYLNGTMRFRPMGKAPYLKDKKKILPCAAYLEGEYGINGLFMGVPVKLGKTGIEEIIQIELTDKERAAFQQSAAAVQDLIDDLKKMAS